MRPLALRPRPIRSTTACPSTSNEASAGQGSPSRPPPAAPARCSSRLSRLWLRIRHHQLQHSTHTSSLHCTRACRRSRGCAAKTPAASDVPRVRHRISLVSFVCYIHCRHRRVAPPIHTPRNQIRLFQLTHLGCLMRSVGCGTREIAQAARGRQDGRGGGNMRVFFIG
ncbi:hypothetical protein C8J57DRAFT_1332277 [Mycena rebaudengoi]|nr:hypothetical protein C8J57DRAFT_1332277 [Mycena rebaudengoi]